MVEQSQGPRVRLGPEPEAPDVVRDCETIPTMTRMLRKRIGTMSLKRLSVSAIVRWTVSQPLEGAAAKLAAAPRAVTMRSRLLRRGCF